MAAERKHHTVGHYVVLKLIGKGSYGQVHLVKNRRDKRQVMIYITLRVLLLLL